MRNQQLNQIDLPHSISMEYCIAGEGIPIVYLHGYSDSWYSFSKIAGKVQGAKNILLTHRGHGGSEKPKTGNTIQAMAQDALLLMDYLEVESAILCGHSMGTLIAQEIAAKTPERAAHLVLVGAAASADTELLRGLSEELVGFDEPVQREFVAEFQYSTINLTVAEDFMSNIIDESLKMPARMWKPVLDALIDYHVPKEICDIPSDICWGNKDAIFPRMDQEALMGKLPSAEFREFPGAGHGLHWECPNEIANVISSAVKQCKH